MHTMHIGNALIQGSSRLAAGVGHELVLRADLFLFVFFCIVLIFLHFLISKKTCYFVIHYVLTYVRLSDVSFLIIIYSLYIFVSVFSYFDSFYVLVFSFSLFRPSR